MLTWGTAHCAVILALLYYTRRSEPHQIAAMCLLVWFLLRNLGYEKGVYETEVMYQTMAAFIFLSVLGFYKYRHMLFVGLVGLGGAVCIFNGMHSLSAYWAKTVLGVLFQLGVLAVFISCLISRRTNSPL